MINTAAGTLQSICRTRKGMSSLVATMSAQLPTESIQLNSPIKGIAKCPEGGWRLILDHDSEHDSKFDGVILATPAPQSSRLLSSIKPKTSQLLNRIPQSSSAVISLGFRRNQITHPLDGFGFVVPLVENRRILSGSFASVKYTGRAPNDCVLLRVFIGGACQSELVDLDDDRLIEIATEELRELLSVSGEPVVQSIKKHRNVMPQYHVGHGQLVEEIEQKIDTLEGLELAGNAYHGVGIPYCIQSGETAANKIVKCFAKQSASI